MRSVTIVGSGLVGSLWAVLLRQHGYAVTMYERRPDPRHAQFTEHRSINLVITSRGLHGLECAGLLKAATDLSVPIKGRMIHALDGATTYQPYGQKNECNLSISRGALNHFLIDAAERAGAKIYFEHELQNINFSTKTCTFKNNQSVGYDLLFGADGAGSLVRKNIIQHQPEHTQDHIEWLEAEYIELFLPAGANGASLIEKNALHIWPRGARMMMALANLDGSFTVTLYMPNAKALTTAQDVQNLFHHEFRDAIALMPNYQQDFLNNPKGRLGTVRCSNWVQGDSVALIGDAAHGILPFFGQGMNSGFEDCTYLLDDLARTQHSWPETLKNYNTHQRPNGNAIADMAIENWFEMSSKVADPNFLQRKKIEALLEQNFPQMFKSRYGMVTYTLIPYALVQQAGRILDPIIDELCVKLARAPSTGAATAGAAIASQNFAPTKEWLQRAENLLKEKYLPFLEKNKIVLA